MAGVLFVGDLQEESSRLISELLGLNVRGAGQRAKATVVKEAQLIHSDGHIAAQSRLRCGEHLTGQCIGLGELAAPFKEFLQILIVVGVVRQSLADVKEVELLLGHIQPGIGTVLQHRQAGSLDDRAGALLPEGILLILDGDQAADRVAEIFVHGVVNLLSLHGNIVLAVACVDIGSAFPLDPGLALRGFAVHPLQIRIVGHEIHVSHDTCAEVQILLIGIPDGF